MFYSDSLLIVRRIQIATFYLGNLEKAYIMYPTLSYENIKMRSSILAQIIIVLRIIKVI